MDNTIIGHHDASIENLYGANVYRKPRGVGYTYRPRGGLHPVYVVDVIDVDENDIVDDDDVYDDGLDYDWIELRGNENHGGGGGYVPYADVRLDMTREGRELERTTWENKMREIRDTYGYWNFSDVYYGDGPDRSTRPVVDWMNVGRRTTTTTTGGKGMKEGEEYDPSLGEIRPSDFPRGTWQTDDAYVSRLIDEGRKLVNRVRNAMYDEVGWEDVGEGRRGGGIRLDESGEGTTGGITYYGGTKDGVVGWMYESSFRALSKKLLNAMITNDHFYVTLGGHSAAAGHGNNFRQSYMMEFQRVMEPVFDRLGMILVSANRAQGGMGTIQSALAGVSIYGDADFVLWDSSMTEKDGRAKDLFMRQALLAGKRVPILFDMGNGKGTLDGLHLEVGAHVGGVMNDVTLLPKFKNATINFDERKYNAKCWTARTDVKPDVPQNEGYGGQTSWHPGNWVHQSTARKLSLVFLHALDEAFAIWEAAASADGNPLPGKYWHLRDEENAIRDAVKKANVTTTGCGQLFSLAPRLCATPMRGAGEWTPRNDPYHSSIRSLVKPAPSGYVPGIIDLQEIMYRGRDPHIPSQRLPIGEVDVAAIARSLPPRDGKEGSGLTLSSSTRPRRRRTGRYLKGNNTLSGGRMAYSRVLDSIPPPAGNIIPGEGWTVQGHPTGFCDGTSNSVCYRQKSSNCLMSGHNDGRGTMEVDALSGWLVLKLKDITQGLFMARMEPWHNYYSNKRTEGWVAVNNGTDDSRRRRRTKAAPPPLPPEFRLEVAVNGVLVTSWNGTELLAKCLQPSYNNIIGVLWNDEDWAMENKKEDVELALRLLGPDGAAGRTAVMGVTHIYYA
ncbi:hypothetical protein ACHAXA_010821 [Cyclostephanos tholiformis]|uniref:Uncharacterized protein n=1 Tax=Cyclostephanos tholiformis TaxID=382380 RepID=A0ABD3SG56_9STRA